MLSATHAIRLGLRAATRNPELPFAKALVDQVGTMLSILPPALAGLALAAMLGGRDPLAGLAAVPQIAMALRWPLLGAIAAALLIAWLLGVVFWAGALPVLAADAEMGARPPPGAFFDLLSRGFARVLASSALAGSLVLLFGACCVAAAAAAIPAFLARPSLGIVAGVALLATTALVGGLLIDLLARLAVVRSAALGDGAVAALFRGASLLGGRLGTLVGITVLFLLLETMVSAAAAALTGVVSSAGMFDPGAQLIGIAPRLAAGLAFAAVLAWLEVGRQGALAAIAADAEGLLPPPPPAPGTAERVVEAHPAPVVDATAEPVVDATAEPVVEALPVDDTEE